MRPRDYYFDNAKFILIFFVVFGHLLKTFIEDNEIIYSLYKTIYTFHMPAFILVSGFFAKGIYEKGYVRKFAKKLILPYIIFQIIYSIFYFYLYSKSTFKMDLLNPHWSLWFLISLFFWNLMLLAFSKAGPVNGLAASLVIALLVGYVDSVSNYLSLSRTFVFFPMFLLGYHLRRDHLKQLVHLKGRAIAFSIFAVVFIGFYFYPDINYKWLLGSKPYSELEAHGVISMLTRLGFYMVSLIMVFSFLAFVPSKQYFFTKWGKQTLYVYLLHGFIVRFFRESEITGFFTSVENFLLLAAISLLMTMILSSSVIASFAQPIIELKMNRFKGLYKKLVLYIRFYRERWKNQTSSYN
ncbi:acyltransferase [Bacillus sp. M6-12]|uniref:acyltransferase family protein n=1 Tax=Bacillus sp. M6-12 TaxID=2054166 RepID=UPI000C778AFA|nr:acyltransferase family protein [Bacillus sp. M6-12]PLS16436.1 acyltransferase [Bacillus sp. M6-12]